MDNRIWSGLVTFFGGLTLLLLVANMWLATSNNELQHEVERRQSLIKRGEDFYQLTVRLAGTLSDIANEYDDHSIREMLFAEDPPGVKPATHGNSHGPQQ